MKKRFKLPKAFYATAALWVLVVIDEFLLWDSIDLHYTFHKIMLTVGLCVSAYVAKKLYDLAAVSGFKLDNKELRDTSLGYISNMQCLYLVCCRHYFFLGRCWSIIIMPLLFVVWLKVLDDDRKYLQHE